MGYYTPQEVTDVTIEKGVQKAGSNTLTLLVLGFLGGAFISLGYLLYIRVVGTAPHEWGSIATFIGASVFPVGLVCILLGGGELITGNMMAVSLAWFDRKISFGQLLRNFAIVTVANLIGALFVAYFFGHFVGLTEGDFLEKTIATAGAKIKDPFWVAFVSGIGCNWFVGIAVWLSYAAKDFSGKILGIWFPVMAFVAIGFQHVVANMFIIPAAIFAGSYSWMDFLMNVIPVYLGNTVGGAVFVSLFYYLAYKKSAAKTKEEEFKEPATFGE
ncbi:formate/nitrite transporter [Listeria floridensis FSL S10-1187]|uniref:Formate/nitrite transporter n=1 Tax=Listeria floridensis FSL S10-1187 TaxID=1265817 RepID=A0ABP3AVL4_9LIST|nr:formate/nitrite transporter family protein [Listeria floridensis]EUJ28031.1 formate/nitrite transporter [Listeria floridensis FSL S10-1187]